MSGTFRYVEENLNYSKESILAVFGKYFKTEGDAEAVLETHKLLLIVYTVTGWVTRDKDGCTEDVVFCNAQGKTTIPSLQRTWIYQKL